MRSRTRRSDFLWMLMAVAGLTLLPTSYVGAYLDPGSGSFIFQILVAGFLGFLFMLRIFWDRIVVFFRKLVGRPRPPVEETVEE